MEDKNRVILVGFDGDYDGNVDLYNKPVGEPPKKPEPFLRDRFGRIGAYKGGKGKNPGR